jgi:hypothetical protein
MTNPLEDGLMQQDYRHPITPPPQLVKQWCHDQNQWTDFENIFALRAAQWGADQELEACCEVLDNLNDGFWSEKLRAARRPKPPSLKEQAQSELDRLIALIPAQGALAMAEPIRRALEQLDD